LQGPLRGKKWIAGASTHGCWLGSYELGKQTFFSRKVQAGHVVFDVGANVGFYTLLAAQLVGPTGKVVAFEPVARNLHYLREHLRLNCISDVIVIDAAVSDSDGEVNFDPSSNNSTGHFSSEGALRVRTVRLDDIVFREHLPPPDCVKIDVEGAELMVLLGAERIIAQKKPLIFLATHSSRLHCECCNYLKSAGYRLLPISGQDLQQCDEIVACSAN
jgi:FkbM family methyltransferase